MGSVGVFASGKCRTLDLVSAGRARHLRSVDQVDRLGLRDRDLAFAALVVRRRVGVADVVRARALSRIKDIDVMTAVVLVPVARQVVVDLPVPPDAEDDRDPGIGCRLLDPRKSRLRDAVLLALARELVGCRCRGGRTGNPSTRGTGKGLS